MCTQGLGFLACATEKAQSKTAGETRAMLEQVAVSKSVYLGLSSLICQRGQDCPLSVPHPALYYYAGS